VTIERFFGCADSAVLIFERTLITCLHDVRLFHWLVHMLGWRGTISMDCPKSRLLTQHNQEIAQ